MSPMFIRALYRGLREFLSENSMGAAAAIAFYVLFSLFPMLIFLVSILGMFLRDSYLQQKLIEGVIDLIPAAGDRETNLVVQSIRGITHSTGVSSALGFALMAWSGSGMFRAVRHAVDRAYETPVRRSFMVRRLTDVIMIFAVGFFFLLSLFASAVLHAAQQAGSWISGIVGLPLVEAAVGEAGIFWKVVSYAVPTALSVLAFFFLYWLVPASTRPRASIWAGALTAAVLFEATKMGFVYYLSHYSRYNLIFGPLGTVVAFLFWIYLSAMILLYGAEVIAAYSVPKRARKSSERKASSSR